MSDGTVDIGQAEVAAGVAVRQLFVIETHQVENGRVEVVHVHPLFNRRKTKIIAGSIDGPSFYPATCQPDGEPVVVVVPALRSL